MSRHHSKTQCSRHHDSQAASMLRRWGGGHPKWRSELALVRNLLEQVSSICWMRGKVCFYREMKGVSRVFKNRVSVMQFSRQRAVVDRMVGCTCNPEMLENAGLDPWESVLSPRASSVGVAGELPGPAETWVPPQTSRMGTEARSAGDARPL